MPPQASFEQRRLRSQKDHGGSRSVDKPIAEPRNEEKSSSRRTHAKTRRFSVVRRILDLRHSQPVRGSRFGDSKGRGIRILWKGFACSAVNLRVFAATPHHTTPHHTTRESLLYHSTNDLLYTLFGFNATKRDLICYFHTCLVTVNV